MTRLRQPERLVLDTLVEAGVARSRSDALAWCVAPSGRNAQEWLGELREVARGRPAAAGGRTGLVTAARSRVVRGRPGSYAVR